MSHIEQEAARKRISSVILGPGSYNPHNHNSELTLNTTNHGYLKKEPPAFNSGGVRFQDEGHKRSKTFQTVEN